MARLLLARAEFACVFVCACMHGQALSVLVLVLQLLLLLLFDAQEFQSRTFWFANTRIHTYTYIQTHGYTNGLEIMLAA